MGTNSATQLATQQSIKAYVDSKNHTGLTGSTNNQLTTVTGANAIQGEANLLFDGTTLTVTGVLSVDYVQLKDNHITTNSSNADLEISANGSGTIDVQNAMTTIGQTVTGTVSVTGQLNADNLRLDGNTFSSTNSNGDITIAPNGTGNVVASTDTLQVASAASEQANLVVTGGEAAAARVAIAADDGDDASDTWDLVTAVGGTLSIGNDIASKGTSVAQLVLTPHATVASSTTAVVGALTVAGATTFSGAVNMNSQATTNVNIDSGAIDGVTFGSNSVITTATIDDININGQTISTTASNNNIILRIIDFSF